MRAIRNLLAVRRRQLRWALVLGAALAICLSGVAAAKWNVFRAGNVILKVDGGPQPEKLPRHEQAPIGVFGKFQIATGDGSHPPAFRGGTFYVDRNAGIEARGLPVCKGAHLEARNSKAARRVCGEAIVGTGQGTVEIAFPEQSPIHVVSPLTFFNGGVRGGTTTVFVHAFITVPVPAAIVTTLKFTEIDKGRYGMRLDSEVPAIAGGSGSTIAARFAIKRLFSYRGERRSLLTASCPDGRLLFRVVSTEFELAGARAGVPLSGSLSRPCIPRD